VIVCVGDLQVDEGRQKGIAKMKLEEGEVKKEEAQKRGSSEEETSMKKSCTSSFNQLNRIVP
jgi:hypothetical protein